MIIKSVSGRILFNAVYKTMRASAEYAVSEGVDLSGADFRSAKLSGAALDGINAKGASFWGADLCGADMGLSDLRSCDLRCADLKDTCLAETDLSDADLRGTYFSGTIIEGAILDSVRVSCPSFWDCDLQSADSMRGLTFIHRGETNVPLNVSPLVVRGLDRTLVIAGAHYFWGGALFHASSLPRDLEKSLFHLKTVANRGLASPSLRNATGYIPKIVSPTARI